jgi:hypothetical protein
VREICPRCVSLQPSPPGICRYQDGDQMAEPIRLGEELTTFSNSIQSHSFPSVEKNSDSKPGACTVEMQLNDIENPPVPRGATPAPYSVFSRRQKQFIVFMVSWGGKFPYSCLVCNNLIIWYQGSSPVFRPTVSLPLLGV